MNYTKKQINLDPARSIRAHLIRIRKNADTLERMLDDNLTGEMPEQLAPMQWIDANSALPPMFRNVIVWGILPGHNVGYQAWQARRWTGCSHDVEEKKLWDWMTPTDRGPVKDVTHWMPLPEVVLSTAWKKGKR